jgi:hypothetical protein
MSNEVALLPGNEIVISGSSVGVPERMYGAIAKLDPEDGLIDSFKGDPYTTEMYFRLCCYQ